LKVIGVVKFTVGYAKIEWQSTDEMLQKSLIGAIREFRYDGSRGGFSGGNMLINNGRLSNHPDQIRRPTAPHESEL